ncbi:hypothetical protein ABH920_001886 [Catenulispora sp. EB89]|uniref:hypothetical protein n=1 Tax=Catenulispora sp. EB89 TaxID=3156257 RepID=UPI003511B7A8
MTDTAEPVTYQTVLTSVRPPRAVTLICSEGDWHADALRMLECYARTWGGDGNGLVAWASDGQILEAFWPLLAALDADQWVGFARTPLGLRMSDPAAYEQYIAAQAKGWAERNNVTEAEARQALETPEFLSPDGGYFATADDERIRNVLAPAVNEHVIIHGQYAADSAPPQGLVDMCDLDYAPERVAEVDMSSLAPLVQLLVGARTGLIAPSFRTHLQSREETEFRSVVAAPADLAALLEYAWTEHIDTVPKRFAARIIGETEQLGIAEHLERDFTAYTPAAHSRLGCDRFGRLDKDSFTPAPLVVVCGDSAEDFCYAYTRQRVTNINTFWLPLHSDSLNDESAQVMCTVLTRVLSRLRRSHYGEHEVLLTSLTLTADQLEAVRTSLLATRWLDTGYGIPVPGPVSMRICAPEDVPVKRTVALLDAEHFATESTEPFVGADMQRTLEILRPSKAHSTSPDAYRWRVDVERIGHILPARWKVQDSLKAAGSDVLMPGAVRSSTAGISVDSHGKIARFNGSPLSQILTRTRLHFPDAAEIFRTLLDRCGASMEESDKGRYTRRILDMWGGLPALAADLHVDSAARGLLNHWISNDQSYGRIHHDRKYLRMSDIKMLTGMDQPTRRALIDRFLDRGIAHRGLVLRCRLCADSSFYHLADIGPGYWCPRCRQHNAITDGAWTTAAHEPEWFYSLDEIVYLALDNNIHVPILALNQLAATARSFLHMPEVIVRRQGETDLEVDLWAIVDGHIVIGEAKKGDKLDESPDAEVERCRRLKRLVHDLTVDELVLATADSRWSQRTVVNLEREMGSTATARWMTGLR